MDSWIDFWGCITFLCWLFYLGLGTKFLKTRYQRFFALVSAVSGFKFLVYKRGNFALHRHAEKAMQGLDARKIAYSFSILFLVSPFAFADDSILVSQTQWESLLQRVERLEKKQMTPDSLSISAAEQPRIMNSERKDKFTIGGYGEATMSRKFYSNNYKRYTNPEGYKHDSYGEFDLPHVVIYLGYDFGKGWSMSSEIEYEHGGTEVAVEVEAEENGEYETEVERGGEVFLEQFWLQKSFCKQANIRAGMLIVPMGGTNAHHEPNQFFGVFRPQGDNTILPCTWHELGIQFHGRHKWLGYTAQFLAGMESDLFGCQYWVKNGASSPYEFKLGNTYAGLGRLDFYPTKGLRLSATGYCGNTFHNTLQNTSSSKYDNVHGTLTMGSVELKYQGFNWIIRGSGIYGHLADAATITSFNLSMSKNSISKRQSVASDAYSFWGEVGYDFFGLNAQLAQKQQKFYLFFHYDNFNSQYLVDGKKNYSYSWCGRQRFSAGFNYSPLPELIIKGEYAYGLLNKAQNADGEMYRKYNPEPEFSVGITYCGFFKL